MAHGFSLTLLGGAYNKKKLPIIDGLVGVIISPTLHQDFRRYIQSCPFITEDLDAQKGQTNLLKVTQLISSRFGVQKYTLASESEFSTSTHY